MATQMEIFLIQYPSDSADAPPVVPERPERTKSTYTKPVEETEPQANK